MTEIRPFYEKIRFLVTLSILRPKLPIKCFESFQFFESPYQKATFGCYAISGFKF